MDERVLEEALRWHAATTRDDCDWPGFTQWLEASPEHRRAYDDIALLDERIARHGRRLAADAAQVVAPHDPVAQRRRHWPWVGAAVAACAALVLFVAVPRLPSSSGGDRAFLAQADASRAVSLDGGMQVVLAPGSSMQVSGRHDQRIQLTGSAWFDIPHDPRRELVIQAGAYQIRDIGTRFEVVSAANQLKVAVAEGKVGVVLPGRAQPVPVNAGQHLLVAGDPPIAEYGDVAADDVAGWRAGRLVFRNEPLSMVAAQLGPHAGLTVTVDPSIAQRRFSGVLAIGDGSQLVAQLRQIMDLQEQRTGSGVHLVAAGESPGSR